MTIRIEKGVPTSEELAALVGVLAGLASSTSEPPPPSAAPAWWRSGLPVMRGSWRESALPKVS